MLVLIYSRFRITIRKRGSAGVYVSILLLGYENLGKRKLYMGLTCKYTRPSSCIKTGTFSKAFVFS